MRHLISGDLIEPGGAAVLLAVFLAFAAPAVADEPIAWFRPGEEGEHGCVPRAVEAADLLTLREIGGMTGTGLSVSPDGRFVAFEAHQADIETDTYRAGWFVAPTDRQGPPVYVGGAGNPTLFRNSLPDGRVVGAWISQYPKWSPESESIAYRKKSAGSTQIWLSGRDGHAARQLTHNAADVVDFYWSDDGSKLLFTTGATRADIRRAREKRYRQGYVYDYDKDWSTIDAMPYFPPYELTGGEARLWAFETKTGRERPATDQERVEYETLGEGPESDESTHQRYTVASGDKLGTAWLQPDDPEKQGSEPPMTLYAALDGRPPTRCSAEECTGAFDTDRVLRNVLHWPGVDDEVIFVRKEGVAYSRRAAYAWHPGDREVRKIFSSDKWISDCSIIRHRAICFSETPTYPRTIISLELNDGSARTLVDLNPRFGCLELGQVELMKWENDLGYETFGYLVTPPNAQPGKSYPLVFVGYRARLALRGGVGDEYPVHLLAQNGFVVLVYEKPTAYEAQEKYSDPIDIGRARWGTELFDVKMPLSSFKAAIKILVDRNLVDPDRVAITGLSNGAAHVNYAIIHSDLFSAAITSSCEFSPSGRVLSGASGPIREYRKAIGAGPYPGPEGFIFPQLSLSLNASRVSTPLLINGSDLESPSALGEVVALLEAGKAVEMIVYPDEGHIKWHPAHRASIYERNLDWLKFWLTGATDGDERKMGQYSRWAKLRRRNSQSE